MRGTKQVQLGIKLNSVYENGLICRYTGVSHCDVECDEKVVSAIPHNSPLSSIRPPQARIQKNASITKFISASK